MAIEVEEQILELAATDAGEVIEGLAAEEGEGDLLAPDFLAKLSGVEEDAGVVGLAHHVGELPAAHIHVKRSLQVLGGKRGTLGSLHRRQLRIVTDEEQAVVGTGIDEVDEILQQAAHAGNLAGMGVGGNHGRLVHDEKRVGKLVFPAEEHAQPIAGGHTVDPLVDGERLAARILGDHLGGTTRGGQEDGAHADVVKRLHQSAHQSGLARAGVALQDKQETLPFLINKVGKPLHRRTLALCGREAEMGQKPIVKCALHGVLRLLFQRVFC